MSNKTKGIVLAGGSGTRLHPLVAAQATVAGMTGNDLLSFVNTDAPGIQDILLISTPHDLPFPRSF